MDINIIWETETTAEHNKEDLEKLLQKGLEIAFQMITVKGTPVPESRLLGTEKGFGEDIAPKKSFSPEIGLLLTDDEGIHVLNRDYRGLDVPTDVLSFALQETEDDEVSFEHEGHMLGDIVISVETAANQAPVHGNSTAQEMVFLAVHALLHLLGYDHERDEDYQVMRQWEELIMLRINEMIFAG